MDSVASGCFYNDLLASILLQVIEIIVVWGDIMNRYKFGFILFVLISHNLFANEGRLICEKNEKQSDVNIIAGLEKKINKTIDFKNFNLCKTKIEINNKKFAHPHKRYIYPEIYISEIYDAYKNSLNSFHDKIQGLLNDAKKSVGSIRDNNQDKAIEINSEEIRKTQINLNKLLDHLTPKSNAKVSNYFSTGLGLGATILGAFAKTPRGIAVGVILDVANQGINFYENNKKFDEDRKAFQNMKSTPASTIKFDKYYEDLEVRLTRFGSKVMRSNAIQLEILEKLKKERTGDRVSRCYLEKLYKEWDRAQKYKIRKVSELILKALGANILLTSDDFSEINFESTLLGNSATSEELLEKLACNYSAKYNKLNLTFNEKNNMTRFNHRIVYKDLPKKLKYPFLKKESGRAICQLNPEYKLEKDRYELDRAFIAVYEGEDDNKIPPVWLNDKQKIVDISDNLLDKIVYKFNEIKWRDEIVEYCDNVFKNKVKYTTTNITGLGQIKYRSKGRVRKTMPELANGPRSCRGLFHVSTPKSIFLK